MLDESPPARQAPAAVRLRRGTRKAMHRLLDRAARLAAEMDSICSGHGITRDQYEVLRVLQGAGPGGLSRRGIAERLPGRSPDVTRLLDRLSRGGFVSRGPGEPDRRQRLTRLTDQGMELLDRMRPELDGALVRFSAPLPRRGLKRLGRLLGRLDGAPALPAPAPDDV